MDRWGHCDVCARWFYMTSDSTTCPVCREAPATVVDRDKDPDEAQAGPA